MLQHFVNTLLPVLSLIIQPQDNSSVTCVKQDFSQRCINRGDSFYMNGLCYHLPTVRAIYALGGRNFRVQEYCWSIGMSLASIPNVDTAEMFTTFYKIVTENLNKHDIKHWIDGTDSSLTVYGTLNGLKTIDEQMTIEYEYTKGRFCHMLSSHESSELTISIDNCSGERSFYCESSNFSQEECLSKDNSFYCVVDDTCYQAGIKWKNEILLISYSEAQNYCLSIDMRLASVHNVDLAQMLMDHYRNITQFYGGIGHWIEGPQNDLSMYLFLHGRKSLNGVATMAVQACTTLTMVNSSHLSIDVATSDAVCQEVHPFYCESAFIQKPCRKYRTPHGTHCGKIEVVTSNVSECIEQCKATTWCTGVNFNSANGTCHVRSRNVTDSDVECEPIWVYFERT